MEIICSRFYISFYIIEISRLYFNVLLLDRSILYILVIVVHLVFQCFTYSTEFRFVRCSTSLRIVMRMRLLIQPSFKIITSLTRHHLIASRPTLFLYLTLYLSHPLSLIVISSFLPSLSLPPYYQPNIIFFHALPSSSWTFPDFHALPSSSKITRNLSEFPRTLLSLVVGPFRNICREILSCFIVIAMPICPVVSACSFCIIYISNFGIYKI